MNTPLRAISFTARRWSAQNITGDRAQRRHGGTALDPFEDRQHTDRGHNHDQGTTSSRALVFDHEGAVRAVAQREFRQHFPRPVDIGKNLP